MIKRYQGFKADFENMSLTFKVADMLKAKHGTEFPASSQCNDWKRSDDYIISIDSNCWICCVYVQYNKH